MMMMIYTKKGPQTIQIDRSMITKPKDKKNNLLQALLIKLNVKMVITKFTLNKQAEHWDLGQKNINRVKL